MLTGPGCYFCAVCVFRERIFQQLWRSGKSQPCPIMARGRGRWIADPTNALKFQETRPEGQQGSLAFTSRCPPARQQGFAVTPRVSCRADTGPSDLAPCRLSLGPCPAAVASTPQQPRAPGALGPEAGGRGSPPPSDSGVCPADGATAVGSRPVPLSDQRCLELRCGWEWPPGPGGQGNTVRTCCGASGVRTFPQGTGAFPTYCPTELGGMPALRAPPFPPAHPRLRCRSAQVLTPCISVLKSSCTSLSIPEAPLVPGHHQEKTSTKRSWGTPRPRPHALRPSVSVEPQPRPGASCPTSAISYSGPPISVAK